MSDKQPTSEPQWTGYEFTPDEISFIRQIAEARIKPLIEVLWKYLDIAHKGPVHSFTDINQSVKVLYLRPASLYDPSEEIYKTREVYLEQIADILQSEKTRLNPNLQETVNTLWHYIEDMHGKKTIDALFINGRVYKRPMFAKPDNPFPAIHDRK